MDARLHPVCERAVVAIFVVAIALPAVATLLHLDRETTTSEKKVAPPALEASWDSLAAYPEAFTRYFEENFAFRTRLVRWQAAFRVKALQVSSSPSVFLGRNGWLYYTEDGAIDDYASAPPFTSTELEIWRRALQDTNDWLKARGIAYVFVVAPDKHLVYPEFMPGAIRPAPYSRVEQLVSHLAHHSTVPVVDLRAALADAKTRERIYHLTDTHWNDRGAFVGYTQILDAISHQRPELMPLPRSLFTPVETATEGRDLAGMLGLTSTLPEIDLQLEPRVARTARVIEPPNADSSFMYARVITERPDGKGPRAVVFRDSFTSALIPFLSEHFSRAVYLWQNDLEPAVIDQEHPDVVIQEWVGRHLSIQLPYDAVADQVRLKPDTTTSTDISPAPR